MTEQQQAVFDSLDPINRRICQLVGLGYENGEIAELIGCLAQRGIKERLNRLYRKFGCTFSHRRLELAMTVGGIQFPDKQLQPVRISRRQQQLIPLVMLGKKNREIGEAVGLSEAIIKNYLRRIYQNAGVRNRIELAAWYIQYVERQKTNAASVGTDGSVAGHDIPVSKYDKLVPHLGRY